MHGLEIKVTVIKNFTMSQIYAHICDYTLKYVVGNNDKTNTPKFSSF